MFKNILYVVIGILIPFIGTALGSSFVFFLKKKLNINIEKLIIGFAAGVMISASIWSLIIPSVEMSSNLGYFNWVPALVGLVFGVLFLVCIKKVTRKLENINMLSFSVTLHNIPEGMAVGVLFSSFLNCNLYVVLVSAFVLSIGIAIQNIPEGAIISMPLKMKGISKGKSFLYGVLSGVVEPIGSIATILLTSIIVPILPYLLSFASGAMIYVVVEELIPEMHKDVKSPIGIIGFTLGFSIMMVLDITLG